MTVEDMKLIIKREIASHLPMQALPFLLELKAQERAWGCLLREGYNIIVSCATSSPVLSNRERFPNYFQLLPSFIFYSPVYLAIIKQFKWRHVVMIVQDESLFTVVSINKQAEITFTCAWNRL